MSTTFPAAANINNVAFPFSFVGFGTRPNNTGGVNLINKGANLFFADNSGTTTNAFEFKRLAASVDARAVSNETWTTSDGSVHFAITVSAGGVVKLYKNNVEATYLVQTTGSGSLTSDAASDLVIDLNALSHFAFYNVELSAANISSLYNSGAGANCYTVQSAAILVSTDSAGPPPRVPDYTKFPIKSLRYTNPRPLG